MLKAKVDYFNIFIRRYMPKRLSQRGAEMVEYAIVLACIAAVAAYYYTQGKGTNGAYLKVVLGDMWEAIGNIAKSI